MSTTARRLLELGPNGKPAFRYTRASETNLTETFKRIRREQQKQAAPVNVTPIRKAKP